MSVTLLLYIEVCKRLSNGSTFWPLTWRKKYPWWRRPQQRVGSIVRRSHMMPKIRVQADPWRCRIQLINSKQRFERMWVCSCKRSHNACNSQKSKLEGINWRLARTVTTNNNSYLKMDKLAVTFAGDEAESKPRL